MEEKKQNHFKLVLRILAAIAGIFAMIGGIGYMATFDYGSSMDAGIYTFHDFMRFGSFAMFIILAIDASFELLSKTNTRMSALVGAGCSVLGLVGCFISSFAGMMNAASNATYSNYESVVNGIKASAVVSGVFAIVSAVMAMVSLFALIIKRMGGFPKYNVYSQQGYVQPGYPQQVMPQQSYPQQNFPQQGYPQQNLQQQQSAPQQQVYPQQPVQPVQPVQSVQEPYNQNNNNMGM